MSNDWTNKLRDHLADYQEPVKDDLWAAIEQSLAQQEKTTKQQSLKPAREVILRRFSMAAAIAALAIGGTYVYLHPWNQAEKEIAATTESQDLRDVSASDKADIASASQKSGDVLSSLKNSIASFSQKGGIVSSKNQHLLAEAQNFEGSTYRLHARSCEAHSSEKNGNENELALSSDAQMASVGKTSERKQPSEKNQKSVARSTQEVSSNHDLAMASYDAAIGNSHRSHSGKGWSMTVYGENGVAQKNNNNGNPYLMSDAAVANSPAYFGEKVFMSSPLMQNQLKAIGNMDYTDEVKHHHPISAGVQVGYNLTKRLRLTTGVVYTYTSSDFIGASRGSRVESTQKLHYLGIPLNLNYGVWKANRFHTYVTVGGEGDVNIKNHTETDGVETSSKRDRMQWSVNAAVGAQYDFMPQLGIYVEPGAKYYFDNGSQIENAFKDKKFNFNLQLGLRWNINH